MSELEYSSCKICRGIVHLVNEKHNLVQCEKCELIFCKKKYTQKEFTKLYHELYNLEKAKYKNYSVDEYQMLLSDKRIKIGLNRSRLLKKHVLNKKTKSVIEIGSGVGLIGTYIKRKDRNIRYFGIEIDEKSCNKAKSLGLDCVNGDFSLMKKVNERFDVVMLWEVIEHLQDLKLFIKLANEKLNNNGKIILSTPNYNKIRNYSNGKNNTLYQDTPPIHLNFFTKSNINNIFKNEGFERINTKIKRFPYLRITKLEFFINVLKAVFYRYHGSTIFLVALKK